MLLPVNYVEAVDEDNEVGSTANLLSLLLDCRAIC